MLLITNQKYVLCINFVVLMCNSLLMPIINNSCMVYAILMHMYSICISTKFLMAGRGLIKIMVSHHFVSAIIEG